MLLFIFFVAACSEDDIIFTQDEVIEGDVLTRRQVRSEDNTLVIYTGMSDMVNVQGIKGAFTAKPTNTEITTVTEYDGTNRDRVEVKGCKEGNRVITATDSKGNTASFVVTVRDVEEL